MMTKVAEWASEHAQITNIGLSDGYGEKAILTAVQFGYDRHGSQGYLGNVSSGCLAMKRLPAIRIWLRVHESMA